MPLEINKAIDGSSATASILNTAYGKTVSQASTEPSAKWFAKQIRDRNVLYLNKKKSLKWLRTHANEFRASSEDIDALCTFIVSKDIRRVKTEEDFVQMKHTADERKESRMKHSKRDVYMETTKTLLHAF